MRKFWSRPQLYLIRRQPTLKCLRRTWFVGLKHRGQDGQRSHVCCSGCAGGVCDRQGEAVEGPPDCGIASAIYGRRRGRSDRAVYSTDVSSCGTSTNIDNQCEPLFSIVVSHVGWFRSRRPNMQWWRASKGQGPNYGCRITISSNPVPVLNTGPSLITEVYSGALPRNATAPEVAEWSRSLLGEQVQIPGVALACYLGFRTTASISVTLRLVW